MYEAIIKFNASHPKGEREETLFLTSIEFGRNQIIWVVDPSDPTYREGEGFVPNDKSTLSNVKLKWMINPKED